MLACVRTLKDVLPAEPKKEDSAEENGESPDSGNPAAQAEKQTDGDAEEKRQAVFLTQEVLKANAKRSSTASKWLLALLLVLDLGTMAFIKFYPAVAEMLNNGWMKASPLPVWEMVVPLGLSYIAFQSAGYLIDVYRGKADAPKNPLRTLLFTGYFLQLPQGPISTWKQLQGQLTEGHRMDPTRFVSGFQLMMWGYFKKMVLADRLAPVMEEALKLKTSLTGWLALGAGILYAIRLYADFSGGMDVVRGLSRMLGIELPENFRRPFFAKSVAEYWRRWHITLGAWFRSYLLYPLTSSKFGLWLGRVSGKILGKKTGRVIPTALGTILVFLLIGIWHILNMNAVIYGLYFGVIMALSMLLEPLWKWINKILCVYFHNGKRVLHPGESVQQLVLRYLRFTLYGNHETFGVGDCRQRAADHAGGGSDLRKKSGFLRRSCPDPYLDQMAAADPADYEHPGIRVLRGWI